MGGAVVVVGGDVVGATAGWLPFLPAVVAVWSAPPAGAIDTRDERRERAFTRRRYSRESAASRRLARVLGRHSVARRLDRRRRGRDARARRAAVKFARALRRPGFRRVDAVRAVVRRRMTTKLLVASTPGLAVASAHAAATLLPRHHVQEAACCS